ncbi:MAG: FAD-dependent thymidylate synthase [Candidatus Babeliaceae bacterium]
MENKENITQQLLPLERIVLDPLGDTISSLELTRISGSDLEVVNAARVSYGKLSTQITERDKILIHYLMEHDHTTPFEHNQLSFRVKAPLYVIRQWMRHRMNSYNEISYRYVKAPLEFYIPPVWRQQDPKNRQCSSGSIEQTAALKETYLKSLETARQAYETLLEAGVGREQARGILPLCTYSEFIFTCNLHSLLHFIHLRLAPGAQYEIRVYAQGMLDLVEKHFPVSIEAFMKKVNKTT